MYGRKNRHRLTHIHRNFPSLIQLQSQYHIIHRLFHFPLFNYHSLSTTSQAHFNRNNILYMKVSSSSRKQQQQQQLHQNRCVEKTRQKVIPYNCCSSRWYFIYGLTYLLHHFPHSL